MSKCDNCSIKNNAAYPHPTMLGLHKGPGNNGGYNIKSNKYEFEIINIPKDIKKELAMKYIHNWLDRLCAVEIPTSLMCNLNCKYCYITERWLKNTQVDKNIVYKIAKQFKEKIFDIKSDLEQGREKKMYCTAWGAEPFANLDTLETLIDFCIENKAFFNTSTNGTILNDRAKKILDKMYKNNIVENAIQVSLDGPPYIQNENRPFFNKSGSFSYVIKFLEYLKEIEKKYNLNHIYALCSTIYLSDTSPQEYSDCIDFFSNPENELVFTNVMPMRLENQVSFNKHYHDIFINTIKAGHDTILRLNKERNLKIYDSYSYNLFKNKQKINGSGCYCSAMQTQIAIDLDGNMYMCHGPVTTTALKTYMWLGNIFDNIIDFKAVVTNFDFIYNWTLHSAICKDCVIDKEEGSICNACPPNALVKNKIGKYDYYQCLAYQKCYKYWKEIHEY